MLLPRLRIESFLASCSSWWASVPSAPGPAAVRSGHRSSARPGLQLCGPVIGPQRARACSCAVRSLPASSPSSHTSSHHPPCVLSWDASLSCLEVSGFQALRLRLKSPPSAPLGLQFADGSVWTVGPLSLHNQVNQFLIIGRYLCIHI